MLVVSTLLLFLYIYTSWREWRSTSRICHLFFFSFGIGHLSYNVSFFYFTCTHINIKWWSIYFCFVKCNLNGIFFSAMMRFFSSTVYLCLFLLFYLSSLMYSTWKAYISSTYNTSLQTLIFFSVLVIEGRNKFILKPQIYILDWRKKRKKTTTSTVHCT
jgi:hypothetical protein